MPATFEREFSFVESEIRFESEKFEAIRHRITEEDNIYVGTAKNIHLPLYRGFRKARRFFTNVPSHWTR